MRSLSPRKNQPVCTGRYDVVAGGGSREAEGPDGAEYAKTKRRFVDTNCFIIDESACNEEFPERTMTRFAGGLGGYRQVLPRLHDRPREQPAYTLFTTYGAWLACLRTCFGRSIVATWTMRLRSVEVHSG